jgi:hypothetical protein
MRLDIIKIKRVDIEKLVMEGESLSTGTIYRNIFITSPSGTLFVPKPFDPEGMQKLGEGQLAVVLFDNNERPFCIGYVEINFPQKLAEYLERKVQPGEQLIKNPAGQELYFDRSGNIKLIRNRDGFEYDAGERKMSFMGQLCNFVIQGMEVVFGLVRRGVVGLIEMGDLAHEFVLRLTRKLTGLKVIELSLGDLFDELGIPILGLRTRARALFKVFNDAGISVSEISVDSLGNVKFKVTEVSGEFLNAEVSGLKADLKVLEFNIGQTPKKEKVLLGETFYNLFINHVHTTATGPSSPPTVALPNEVVLSKTTKTD